MAGGEGRKRARLIDVAEVAGVSSATVSYVMSGRRGRVNAASDETIRRIREVAEELGYEPNRHAQAVRRGYMNAIVLALGNPEDPWSAGVALGVQERAAAHGISTLSLVDDTWYPFLRGFMPRVAFVTGTDFSADGLNKVNKLADLGVNLVVFSTEAVADRYDVISSSPLEAVEDAYARLRSRHDRVLLLSTRGPRPVEHGPTRITGFRRAVAAHGDGDADRLIVSAGSARTGIRAASERVLLEGPAPGAVICSTGYLAAIVRDVALLRGLRVPEDLEIVAIGDLPYDDSAYLGPISHYGVPGVFDRIGEILVDRAVMRDQGPFRRHEFTWRYQPGATTVDAR